MAIVVIGLDLAKNIFQVHGVDAAGRTMLRRRLRRSEVVGFFAGLPPALVGMEACHTALPHRAPLGGRTGQAGSSGAAHAATGREAVREVPEE